MSSIQGKGQKSRAERAAEQTALEADRNAFRQRVISGEAEAWSLADYIVTASGQVLKDRYLNGRGRRVTVPDGIAFPTEVNNVIKATIAQKDAVRMVPPDGEERITNASTGGEKGRKPQRFELLPWFSLAKVAEVYAFGASKYADNNWRKGYDWSLSFGAAQRHLAAFWEGEDNDPESGLNHLGHACFHILTLIFFHAAHRDLDDRPRATLGEEKPDKPKSSGSSIEPFGDDSWS